jgi:hypothetical protein
MFGLRHWASFQRPFPLLACILLTLSNSLFLLYLYSSYDSSLSPTMMKFFLGLAALFSALSYSAGAVQIFDDFLSSEECDGFLRQANEKFSVSPNAGVEHPRFRLKIPINRGINERLVVALNNLSAVSCENDDHDDQTCKASGDTPQVQEPEVYISSILHSTPVHKDSIVDKNDKPFDPDGFKVGFVFLDNNDEGYFLHGQDKIEAKKGSFVTFEGRVEHHTVVPSGAKNPMHLLGPFTLTMDKKLSLVGNPCDSDRTYPIARCKDVTVVVSRSSGTTITAEEIDNGSSDACGIYVRYLDKTDFTCDDFILGKIEVTLTVRDDSARLNDARCKATVTVFDNTLPTAVCQDVTIDVSSGSGTITAEEIDNGSSDTGSSDDCLGDVSLSLDKTEFGCVDVGDNTLTLTVTDNNGNENTCEATATVTVTDNTLPTAVCQDVTVDVTSGPVTIEASDINNGSSDACGVESLSLDKTGFGSGDVGANHVTLTVTDNNGNVNTCDATVFANLHDPNLFDADPNMVGNDAASKLAIDALVELAKDIPGLDIKTVLEPVASGPTLSSSQASDALDTIDTNSQATLASLYVRNP